MMRTTVPFSTFTWLGGGVTLPFVTLTFTSRATSSAAAGSEGVGETVTGADGVAKVGVLLGAVAPAAGEVEVADVGGVDGDSDAGSEGIAAVGDATALGS